MYVSGRRRTHREPKRETIDQGNIEATLLHTIYSIDNGLTVVIDPEYTPPVRLVGQNIVSCGRDITLRKKGKKH